MELVRTAELNPPESFWVLDSSTERRQEIVKGIESQGFANLKVFQVDKIERVFSVAAVFVLMFWLSDVDADFSRPVCGVSR